MYWRQGLQLLLIMTLSIFLFFYAIDCLVSKMKTRREKSLLPTDQNDVLKMLHLFDRVQTQAAIISW